MTSGWLKFALFVWLLSFQWPKSEECANRNLFSSTNVNCAPRHCVQYVMTTWYLSLTSISSTFQLSKRPLLAVEFVAPLARIDPIYKEEEEAFKVSDKSPRVRIASRCGKTWSYSILVPSLYSHHKRENTDVSTCEKLKFVWWYWQG